MKRLAIILAATLAVAACSENGNGKKTEPPVVPVAAAAAVLRDVPVTLQVVGSLDQVLRHSGREPQRAWSRATLDTPPDEVATRLQIPADTQVWVVRSLLRDARTRVPLVTSRAYTRVDLVRMVFEFDAR